MVGGLCYFTLALEEKKSELFSAIFKIAVNYLQISSKIANIQVPSPHRPAF